MNGQEIDLNKVLATQEQPLRRLLGETIALEIEPCASVASLYADEGMLGQIVNSLVDFVRQSLPRGTTLRLRSENVEVDETHARIQPGARCGEFVRLTICDDGPGLPAEQLHRLLEQAPQRTAARSGSTLPLPLVAGIIKRRHGWIEAGSHSGGGATISVYFPAATPVTAAMLEAPWVSETIMLVDDEVAIRRMVKSVLQRASYDVVEADTGLQALVLWEQHKERVKLLLTDMVMPDGLTGRALAQRLLAKKPGLKVIYTSGFELDDDARRDTLPGAIRFLHKPYDMRCLLETVHETMTQTELAAANQSARNR